MTDVTGKFIQTEPYQLYNVSRCGLPTGSCQPGDWQYGVRLCGIYPSQPVCSKVNSQACPRLGGHSAKMSNFSQPPNVACTYDVETFSTLPAVSDWISFYGKEEQYNEVIMPYFCSLKATDSCPLSARGTTEAQCSRLRANNEGGLLCREWAALNPDLAEDAMMEYCQKYPRSQDCGCIGRENDPEYRALKQYAPENDGCWYAPCTQSQNYLIPADLRDPICPDNFCAEINRGFIEEQKNFIEYDAAQEATICPLTQPERPPSPDWIILLLWAFLLILVIALVVFGIFSGGETPTEVEVVPGAL